MVPVEQSAGDSHGDPEVTTSIGWGVLHLFCKVQPGKTSAESIISAVAKVVDDSHQVVGVAMFGHKADLGFMAIGPDLWRLRSLQSGLQSAGLEICDSYVSMTELSEYSADLPEEMKTKRLYPQLPPDGKRAYCFYPMSRRRETIGNWYTLDFDNRREMMMEHGKSGRNFRGRIVQLITGSTGVDDHEWGVTLFGEHLDDLKEAVYTMRFDEASAVYGDFGRFYTGLVADDLSTVLKRIGL